MSNTSLVPHIKAKSWTGKRNYGAFGTGDYFGHRGIFCFVFFTMSLVSCTADWQIGMQWMIRLWGCWWALNLMGSPSSLVVIWCDSFGILYFFQWIIPQFSVDPSAQKWGLFWCVRFYLMRSTLLWISLYTAPPQNSLRITTNAPPSLTAFRFLDWWSILSLILAQLFFKVTDPKQQYLVLGACAVISVLPLYWCVWGTRDRVAVLSLSIP